MQGVYLKREGGDSIVGKLGGVLEETPVQRPLEADQATIVKTASPEPDDVKTMENENASEPEVLERSGQPSRFLWSIILKQT